VINGRIENYAQRRYEAHSPDVCHAWQLLKVICIVIIVVVIFVFYTTYDCDGTFGMSITLLMKILPSFSYFECTNFREQWHAG